MVHLMGSMYGTITISIKLFFFQRFLHIKKKRNTWNVCIQLCAKRMIFSSTYLLMKTTIFNVKCTAMLLCVRPIKVYLEHKITVYAVQKYVCNLSSHCNHTFMVLDKDTFALHELTYKVQMDAK